MQAKTIGYWVTTGLTALLLAFGGFSDLASPEVAEGFKHLGYAPYVATILGVWKAAGAVALLLPKTPRLKEWAYAGIFFDFTGAAASHLFAGDGPGKALVPLVLLGLALASWALRPAPRVLGSIVEPPAQGRAPLAVAS